MMLLSYNRKLAWVTVGAICWALFGLAASMGQTRLGSPPLSIHVGAPPGEIRLPGRLLSVTETDGQLELVIAIHGGDLSKLPSDMPHDLSITLEEADGAPKGPPQISLDGHPARIQRGMDSHWIDTKRYTIRFGRDEVRIKLKGHKPQFKRNEELRRQRGLWNEPSPDQSPIERPRSKQLRPK